MTKSPGFTLNLHENKQGQTFALVPQKGPRLCVCVVSSPPQALTWNYIYFNMMNLEVEVCPSHAALWALWGWGEGFAPWLSQSKL